MVRPLLLPKVLSGNLCLSAMPGRFEALRDFVDHCQSDHMLAIIDVDRISGSLAEIKADATN